MKTQASGNDALAQCGGGGAPWHLKPPGVLKKTGFIIAAVVLLLFFLGVILWVITLALQFDSNIPMSTWEKVTYAGITVPVLVAGFFAMKGFFGIAKRMRISVAQKKCGDAPSRLLRAWQLRNYQEGGAGLFQ